MKQLRAYSLFSHNTLHLPCVVNFYMEACSVAEARKVLDLANNNDCKIKILGAGSNVVLPEAVDGMVISYTEKGIKEKIDGNKVFLRVASGESWSNLVRLCQKRGWWGLENLAMIPGAVGAAPVQNIGAYGKEIAEVLEKVEVLDLKSGESFELARGQCKFAYRDSIFRTEKRDAWLITAVHLRLSQGKDYAPTVEYEPLRSALQARSIREPSANDVYHTVCILRRRLPNPQSSPNVGSFFKNPQLTEKQHTKLLRQHPEIKSYRRPNGCFRVAAGYLLDSLGWKGKRQGAVKVHNQHALVLVNEGGASARQILDFSEKMRESVFSHYGIRLHYEPRVEF